MMVLIVFCNFQAHISSPNAELNQAALQALGFCVYHSHVVSGVPGMFMFIYIWPHFAHNHLA